MSALYLTNDLFFSSRVTSAAEACKLEMTVVPDQASLLTQLATGDIHLVLLDWSTPGLDLLDLVAEIRDQAARSVSVVAFGPHVDVAGMAGAKQAGCDAVYTRGQFSSQLQAILRQHGCTV